MSEKIYGSWEDRLSSRDRLIGVIDREAAALGISPAENDAYKAQLGLGAEAMCETCGHPERHHFDDGAGNVLCRSVDDCTCVHRTADPAA
jgi:hypothetical protein